MTETNSADRSNWPSPAEIPSLIRDLESEDVTTRINARTSLADLGAPAVNALVTCLHSPTQHVRWEAAKALESMADLSAAPALVSALADEDQDVRWVVGEALVALGDAGLPSLLMGLIRHSGSVDVCRAAHHVLHDLAKRKKHGELLQEVIRALDSAEPGVTAPPAAWKALRALALDTVD